MAQPQQIILKIGPEVPAMTYKKFAEHIGMSASWVRDHVNSGDIPVIKTKKGETNLINVAKYWQIALSQAY